MPHRFNTAGPCLPDLHYMIPAERRLPEAPGLVEQMGYFVVHAPRQTGKTTALRALARQLTASGRYAALHFSCEEGEAAGDNYGSAQRAVLRTLALFAQIDLPAELRPPPFTLEGDEGLLLSCRYRLNRRALCSPMAGWTSTGSCGSSPPSGGSTARC